MFRGADIMTNFNNFRQSVSDADITKICEAAEKQGVVDFADGMFFAPEAFKGESLLVSAWKHGIAAAAQAANQSSTGA